MQTIPSNITLWEEAIQINIKTYKKMKWTIPKISKIKNQQNITNPLVPNKIDSQQAIDLLVMHPLIYNLKCRESITKNCLKIKSLKINNYKDTFINFNPNSLNSTYSMINHSNPQKNSNKIS